MSRERELGFTEGSGELVQCHGKVNTLPLSEKCAFGSENHDGLSLREYAATHFLAAQLQAQAISGHHIPIADDLREKARAAVRAADALCAALVEK